MSIIEQAAQGGIKKIAPGLIPELCAEIREKILSVTLENGGHLSSSLGAVELTVALLRAFDAASDKIIFDVGHQTYAYKILTDRLDRFNTLRQRGGIAGFQRIDESPYDNFTTGHSSTSISVAEGYAKARDLRGLNYESIAVIGDGALLNGVSFEALNVMSSLKTKVIIVLNDNTMSINPRVGGMAHHLAKIAVSPTYKKFKKSVKERCSKHSENLNNVLSRWKTKLKNLLLPANVFEELDISYWGPFDGHNVAEMEEVFNMAKSYDEPLLIHVITKKGKGYAETEANPSFFHGVGAHTTLGDALKKTSSKSWSKAATDVLCELAEKDKLITALTAAMRDGTKLEKFASHFPDRFFDAGIAEEHMITYAAGLAAAGMHPVVCIYSTFLQRAMDQVMHDITLSKLPVLLCIDRAGLVGEDGETHHGVLDVAWLSALPNMIIASPRDVVDLKFFISEWNSRLVPMAIRYPRGSAEKALARNKNNATEKWGRAELLIRGEEICLLGIGSTVSLMFKAAEEIKVRTNLSVSVVDLRFIKPIDYAMIDDIARKHKYIVTAEENILSGGIGEAIAAHCNANGINCRVLALGIDDKYISHASREEQWEECGLTVSNIVDTCRKLL